MKKILTLSALFATGIFSLWCVACSSGGPDTPATSDTLEEIESAVESYSFDDDLMLESKIDGRDLSHYVKLAEAAEEDAELAEDDEEYYDEEYDEEDVDEDEAYYEDVESDEEESDEEYGEEDYIEDEE